MYKKQMKFQKVICNLALIASAVVFVYSLGLLTDLYESLYYMIPYPDDISTSYVPGAGIYYEMQPFNRSLTIAALVLILLALFMKVMNTHIRRRYYIGNYVAIALYSVASIAVSVWSVVTIAAYKVQYLTTVDFESLKMWADILGSTYTESTFWFDICYAVFGLLVVVTVLLVVNLIWKIRVTKQEKQLIEAGKEA